MTQIFHKNKIIEMEKDQSSPKLFRMSTISSITSFKSKIWRLEFFKHSLRNSRFKSHLARCVISEFIATFFLLFAGLNVKAQTILADGRSNNYTGLSIGWAVAMMFAIYLGFNISGSYLSPAVSLLMYSFGKISFKYLCFYTLAQIFASVVASTFMFFQYYDLITMYEKNRTTEGLRPTAYLFATYPHPNVTVFGTIIDQIFTTFMVGIIIGIITEPRNRIPRTAQPVLFGAMVLLMCLGFGLNAGNAMNPARDLGPRIVSLILGYGWNVFSHRDYHWFFIPLIFPLIGVPLGGWTYHFMVGPNVDEFPQNRHPYEKPTFSTNKVWPGSLFPTPESSPYAGFNVNAQKLLGKTEFGNYTGLSFGWGLAIMFSVQLGYNISGSHMNPAVSLLMFTFGHLSLGHFFLYVVAQTCGAFFASALTFLQYYDLINAFDGGNRTVDGPTATAGLFGTFPHKNLTFFGSFVDQILCTFTLAVVIGIINDPKNKIPRVAQPPMFGAMIFLLCLGFGINAGNAMNPARDFGPRIFTFLAGYGWEVFNYRNHEWWWIPIICPFIGALMGGWSYHLLVAANNDEHFEHQNSLSNSGINEKLLSELLNLKIEEKLFFMKSVKENF